MFNYQKREIVSLAKENGFRSQTLEKVLRLVDVLDFINKIDKLSSCLALKGGTAINLTVFQLPRLSVDIDLDFSLTCSKDEMIMYRNEIASILRRYMEINNYQLRCTIRDVYAVYHMISSNLFNEEEYKKVSYSIQQLVILQIQYLRYYLQILIGLICKKGFRKFSIRYI